MEAEPQPSVKGQAQFTYYSVCDGQVVEGVRGQIVEFSVWRHGDRRWLQVSGGQQSILLDQVPDAIDEGGWAAQFGTKPVYMPSCDHQDEAPACCGPTCQHPNGGWGGRNYPKIFVSAGALKDVLFALQGDARPDILEVR